MSLLLSIFWMSHKGPLSFKCYVLNYLLLINHLLNHLLCKISNRGNAYHFPEHKTLCFTVFMSDLTHNTADCLQIPQFKYFELHANSSLESSSGFWMSDHVLKYAFELWLMFQNSKCAACTLFSEHQISLDSGHIFCNIFIRLF